MLNVCTAEKLTLDKLKDVLAPGIVESVPMHSKLNDILAPGAVRKEKLMEGLNNILAPGIVRNTKLNGMVANQQASKEVIFVRLLA